MLSLTRVTCGQAQTYYSKDDYYLESGGEWFGEGANFLGLTGKIKEEDFKSLTTGKAPNGEFQIQSGGQNFEHTAGVDLTFSAPKSVSILGLVLDDTDVVNLHNEAVNDVLSYIEKNNTGIRLKTNGTVTHLKTDNLVVAKFKHVSSRAQDPQLHTHCVVLNATKKDDGNWRAVDYKNIFDNKHLLGQIYRSSLAGKLKKLGYVIKMDGKGFFEIDGVDEKIIEKFSERSRQIKLQVEELRQKYPDLSEAKLKEMATLDSREKKQEISLNELKLKWENELNNLGMDKNTINQQIKTSKNEKTVNHELSLEDTVIISMRILTETEAVIKKEEIIKVALKLSAGDYTAYEIENQLKIDKRLHNYNYEYYTTVELARIEANILERVKNGKKQSTIFLGGKFVDLNIRNYELDMSLKHNNTFQLTQSQKNAVRHILSSKDKIIAIQGDAGTGKTTMLDCVRYIVENDKQYKINGLSFTGKATHEIQEASRIESTTIASYLNSDVKEESANKILVIDEASMLSIKDLDSIMNKCDEQTKIVLIGDTKQLQAIGQGKIFSTLQEKNVISTIVMHENQRQKDKNYKDAVDIMAQRKAIDSFKKLDKLQKIIEIDDDNSRLNAIKKQYCLQPDETIIVTAFNTDRTRLNTMIRDELKQLGKIQRTGFNFLIRESSGLTVEQRSFASSYKCGDLVIANSSGIMDKIGSEGVVIDVDIKQNTILVENKNKERFVIDLSQRGKDISIYYTEYKEFTAGEKIVFLKNDKGLVVNNGQTGVIQKIYDSGKMIIKLENGKETSINVRSQYSYIDHGYAITDYKSQGQTAKNVVYHANTKAMVNYNQAYVGISRGKENVTIFTDNKERLFDCIQHEQSKTSTLDSFGKAIEDVTTINVKKELSNAFSSISPKTVKSQTKTNSQPPVFNVKTYHYWDSNEICNKLNDNLDTLLEHLIGKKHMKNGRQYRYGKKGSLTVTITGNKAGQWYDFENNEGGKSILSLIQRELNLNFKDSLEYAANFLGLSDVNKNQGLKVVAKKDVKDVSSVEFDEYQMKMIKKAKAIAEKNKPIHNSPAELYLRKRGVTAKMPESISYNPDVYISKYKKSFPAMVVNIYNEKKEIQSVHMTLLDHKTFAKAKVENVKLKYGKTPAVFDIDLNINNQDKEKIPITLIGEGIETCLSIKSALPNYNVKCVLDKGGFNKINLDEVHDKVILCLDNDLKNWKTDKIIMNAISRLESNGKKVTVAIPRAINNSKTDFNDVLLKKGINEIARTIKSSEKNISKSNNKSFNKNVMKIETIK